MSDVCVQYSHFIEEICFSLTALKWLWGSKQQLITDSWLYMYTPPYFGNQLIMVSEVCSAVHTAIAPVTLVRDEVLEFSLAHDVLFTRPTDP